MTIELGHSHSQLVTFDDSGGIFRQNTHLATLDGCVGSNPFLVTLDFIFYSFFYPFCSLNAIFLLLYLDRTQMISLIKFLPS